VGYCQWEDDGHFGPFGVDASTRGLGVGAMLFLEACRRLKQCGAREVWFNWADPDAARFYRRLGLSPVRTFEVMRKEL
jgi:GNAT superfamily N-acetyltransferase